MKYYYFFVVIIFFSSCKKEVQSNEQQTKIENEIKPPAYALVIHGGAGTILKKNMTTEKEEQYLNMLDSALFVGEQILKSGGSSLDAVTYTINVMEDSPLFNAGKGAVFTHNGENELDASIMHGADLLAGAVGGVKTIKNPINAARAVMSNSKHVLLTGAGADQFAKDKNLVQVPPSYFYTKRRWESLENKKSKDLGANTKSDSKEMLDYKFGTVGAVALDQYGDIVAGTSTGGMTNKKWNRIGDSPIIGAGTYANNETAGISCTGHGEFFIRYAVAHDISALMEYKGFNAHEAGDYVIKGKLVAAKGSGGAIILDKDGNIAMPFNTAGMYRGFVKSTGEKEIKIYQE